MARTVKPLFIPLKTEFFDAFASGSKTVEFRQYGARWNEKTCSIGRAVVLSKGYGKKHRLTGVVCGFAADKAPTLTDDWLKCYGQQEGFAACIYIKLDEVSK
jgi:hypothetical protein